MGTVADERRSLLPQRGDDKLSHLSVRYILSCLRVYDLKVQVVIPIVHTALVVAAHGNPRSVHLRQTVDIVKLYAQLRSNAGAHLASPSLRTDDAFFQIDLICNPSFSDLFRQKQRIG